MVISLLEKEKQLLTYFKFEGKNEPVTFIETMDVVPGVQCDVYKFIGDNAKDLGIIRIDPGFKTPLQKVKKGERTIEGYISGRGKLTITKPDGKKVIYQTDQQINESMSVTVEIDEIMQWEADKNIPLTVYEICFPPYENGRYENIK